MKKLLLLLFITISVINYNFTSHNSEITNPSEQKLHLDSIPKGKELFIDNCSMCHNQDLSKHSTGPKLGNITAHRSRKWLIEFTRNSQKMIESADSLALCSWYAWGSVVMNSFEHLTDTEINNIYDFIEYETELKRLDTIETTACDEVTKLAEIRQQKNDSIIEVSTLKWLTPRHHSYLDSTMNQIVQYTYKYQLSNFQYLHIDSIYHKYNEDRLEIVEPFIIKTNEDAMRVFMILKNDKTYIEFEQFSEYWFMQFAVRKTMVYLPYNEPVKIVVISKDGKQVGTLETTIQDENEHIIKLKPLKGKLYEFMNNL